MPQLIQKKLVITNGVVVLCFEEQGHSNKWGGGGGGGHVETCLAYMYLLAQEGMSLTCKS